jgi:endoglucanase
LLSLGYYLLGNTKVYADRKVTQRALRNSPGTLRNSYIRLMNRLANLLLIFLFCSISSNAQDSSWIRINLLGYQPGSKKVAIWCSKKEDDFTNHFSVVDSATGKVVFWQDFPKHFGAYGPFKQTARLDFSKFKKAGVYYLQSGTTRSPYFKIDEDVYKGAADFCLRYMRQQRCGFNPFLKDSCHTHDGYTVYGPMPDGTHIDVTGGWHDASDYLQYVTTSANATYHLLMAERDFPAAFTDEKLANGLDGKNRTRDVLDEAKWGLDWLMKMHPRQDWMFTQIADDRDHRGLRIPKEDSFYNKGFERPVYFNTGEPQGLFQYKNRTTGTSSTAYKFAASFFLGSKLFDSVTKAYPEQLLTKAISSIQFANQRKGNTQTAPGRAPYFYEEDNWLDDYELEQANLYHLYRKTRRHL